MPSEPDHRLPHSLALAEDTSIAHLYALARPASVRSPWSAATGGWSCPPPRPTHRRGLVGCRCTLLLSAATGLRRPSEAFHVSFRRPGPLGRTAISRVCWATSMPMKLGATSATLLPTPACSGWHPPHPGPALPIRARTTRPKHLCGLSADASWSDHAHSRSPRPEVGRSTPAPCAVLGDRQRRSQHSFGGGCQ